MADFIVIGENVHTTRVVRRSGPLVRDDSVVFTDEHGEERLLPVPDEERRTQEYEEGRVKHVRAAVRFVVGALGPVVRVPLSIDSSNLDIILAGMEAAARHGGPPMLNSASLE